MPLPNELLSLLPAIEIELETGQGWRDGAWDGPAEHLPLWILPLGPIAAAISEPTLASQEIEHRLAQAGILWESCTLQVKGHTVSGKALLRLTRAKAVRLGYRLDRWCLIQITSDRLSLVYTGLGSRIDG